MSSLDFVEVMRAIPVATCATAEYTPKPVSVREPIPPRSLIAQDRARNPPRYRESGRWSNNFRASNGAAPPQRIYVATGRRASAAATNYATPRPRHSTKAHGPCDIAEATRVVRINMWLFAPDRRMFKSTSPRPGAGGLWPSRAMQACECKPAIAALNERRSFPTKSSAESWRAPTKRFLALRSCAIRSAGARAPTHALLTHEGNISCRYWFATTTSTRRFGCSRRRCSAKACFAR
jgi:hypothetical protein